MAPGSPGESMFGLGTILFARLCPLRTQRKIDNYQLRLGPLLPAFPLAVSSCQPFILTGPQTTRCKSEAAPYRRASPPSCLSDGGQPTQRPAPVQMASCRVTNHIPRAQEVPFSSNRLKAHLAASTIGEHELLPTSAARDRPFTIAEREMRLSIENPVKECLAMVPKLPWSDGLRRPRCGHLQPMRV